MEALIENMNRLVPISALAKRGLEQNLVVLHFSKKEKIIERGEVCSKLYFVLNGSVRSYQKRNKKEITTWIYHPNIYFAAWDSFLNQSKSEEVFESMADTTLVSIEYDELQALFKKHASLEIWGRKLMEQYTIYFNRFNQQMRFATAQEKYDFYLKHFPQQPKVKLGYIASFLGITQETLSRLRKKQ